MRLNSLLPRATGYTAPTQESRAPLKGWPLEGLRPGGPHALAERKGTVGGGGAAGDSEGTEALRSCVNDVIGRRRPSVAWMTPPEGRQPPDSRGRCRGSLRSSLHV